MVVSDEKVFLTAVDSNTSSCAISEPEVNVKSDDIITVKRLNELLKIYPMNKLVHSNLEKEKKQGSSKCKVNVELSKSNLRCRNLDSKKQLNHPTSTSSQSSKKQPRKCDNPVRLIITDSSDHASILSCKNSACKAILSSEDRFCRKCSCCICYLYDEKKDPSVWLICKSESGDGDWCGLSCHIECALQHKKAGVVDLGQFMKLDGSYCCTSCGKISDIIRFWKQQLAVAKEANKVDILCYRISLSYRLLKGTSKYKELHKFVEDAIGMLETEIGSVNGMPARIVRGNVSRLSVANDVQKRCSLAIMKAEQSLNIANGSIAEQRDSLPPAACTLHFEEISPFSVEIVLNESCSSAFDAIKGYKLWYCKTGEEMFEKDAILVSRAQKKILVPNLQPCTDYVFRLISFSDDGDLGYTEYKCLTRTVEITDKDTNQIGTDGCSSNSMRPSKNPTAKSSGFKVRNLGRTFCPAWAQEEGCSDELSQENDVEEESYIRRGAAKPIIPKEDRLKASVPHQLDLNVASVPDLNDLSPPMESSPEENGSTLEKINLERSSGSGDCQTCAVRVVGEVSAIISRPDCRKPLMNRLTDGCDGDSTLVSAPPIEFSFGSNHLDDNYEYCVKVIRWLECLGHIETDFRMKFLTWFSFRSTEQERWVVFTFVKTLIEEPNCLAEQLLDAFWEIVNCKRPRNGFCSKLWH